MDNLEIATRHEVAAGVWMWTDVANGHVASVYLKGNDSLYVKPILEYQNGLTWRGVALVDERGVTVAVDASAPMSGG